MLLTCEDTLVIAVVEIDSVTAEEVDAVDSGSFVFSKIRRTGFIAFLSFNMIGDHGVITFSQYLMRGQGFRDDLRTFGSMDIGYGTKKNKVCFWYSRFG